MPLLFAHNRQLNSCLDILSFSTGDNAKCMRATADSTLAAHGSDEADARCWLDCQRSAEGID
jgi:hypothetical protein